MVTTALICFFFSRNEFMSAVKLTAVQASTAPVFLTARS